MPLSRIYPTQINRLVTYNSLFITQPIIVFPEINLIELQTLASGDILQLKTYQFKGNKTLKKAYIQANLHGAEIVGNEVIYQLINFLIDLDEEKIRGEIYLVPMCNPVGLNQKNLFFSTGRFNPYDGLNWNRIFWDYTQENPNLDKFVNHNLNFKKEEIQDNYFQEIILKFIQKVDNQEKERSLSFSEHYRNQIQSLSLDANYIIDIHSSSVSAIDYLYCFEKRQSSAELFLLEYAILMNKYDGNALDEASLNPWLVLEKKMQQQGRNIIFDVESWTLELGSGMKVNQESVNKGVKGIINYLSAKKILDLDFIYPDNKPIFIPKNTIKSYYAPQGGIIRHRLPAGEKICQGDILYQLLTFSKKEDLPHIIEVRSLDNGIIYDVSVNDSFNQGEYILGIFPYV